MRPLLLAVLLGAAGAQEPAAPPAGQADEVAEPAVIPGETPGPQPAPAEVRRLTQEIAAGLRCPVCQGLSVGDSTSAAATQMHRRIQALVEAGYDRQQIEDYFTSKYGEWILLDPRTGGLNLLVWLGPLVGLGIAFAAAGALSRRAGPPEDADPDTVVDETITAVIPEDPHTRRLLAEVEDD